MHRIAAVLIGVVAFIAIPMLGWGLPDIHGFFENQARLFYFVAAVLLQVAAAIVLPKGGCGRREGTSTVKRQRVALRLLQLVSITITILAPYCDRRGIATFPNSDAWRYIGLGLFASGLILVVWATLYLGKQFSVQVTLQTDHQLVTSGPYRFLRHPRYSGILMFLVGYCLVFASWLALVLLPLVALVLAWRVYDEEVLMRQAFHAEWDAYAARTARLVPFVY